MKADCKHFIDKCNKCEEHGNGIKAPTSKVHNIICFMRKGNGHSRSFFYWPNTEEVHPNGNKLFHKVGKRSKNISHHHSLTSVIILLEEPYMSIWHPKTIITGSIEHSQTNS